MAGSGAHHGRTRGAIHSERAGCTGALRAANTRRRLERMMPSRVQTLRETNRRLPEWLDVVVARQEQAAVATPEQMSGLLSELLKAGEELRAEPIPKKGIDPELDDELEKYRLNVERLQRM